MSKTSEAISTAVNMEDEPLFAEDLSPLTTGEKAPLFQLDLVNGGIFELGSVLQSGPVILSFIKGFWCPYCVTYLRNLRQWQTKFKKTSTLLVISNQSTETMREWLRENPMLFLFASDEKFDVISQFGLHAESLDFSKPAVYVVDMDGTIKLAYFQRRTSALQDKLEESVGEKS